jgi:stearoyl-CoA desaturase (delta-9 desaturase)
MANSHSFQAHSSARNRTIRLTLPHFNLLPQDSILLTMPAASAAPRVSRAAWYRITRISLSLAPLIGVHLALVAILFVPITWVGAILFVVMTRITGLGITIGFHRYLSHHSFRTSRWFQFALAAAGCTALQKGPLWWVIHHRQHHKHSDAEGDVHSPVRDGFWYGHCGWLFANDLMQPDHASVRDLTRFRELVWLDRFWMLPGLLAAAACYLIGGWAGLVYGYCLSTVVIFQITFAVNSVGHLWGPQRFATGEGSRNNWVLGVIAMGDGWHNNHHRAPTSARHGFAWYEFDMAYLMIRMLNQMGIVWGVRQPPAAVLASTNHSLTPAADSGPEMTPQALT